MTNRKTVAITETDEKLFRYLYGFKVATADQLKRDIYTSYSKRSINRRVSKLIKFGFLEISRRETTRSQRVVSITPWTFKNYIETGSEQRMELKSAMIDHDLDLLDIAAILKRSKQVLEYYPENIIKAHSVPKLDQHTFLNNIHPDALLKVKVKNGTFMLPLEYENSRKYMSRYEELFSRYYGHRDIPAILYICNSENLLRRIQKIEAKVLAGQKPKFCYKLFSELKQDRSLKFSTLNGQPLHLSHVPGVSPKPVSLGQSPSSLSSKLSIRNSSTFSKGSY